MTESAAAYRLPVAEQGIPALFQRKAEEYGDAPLLRVCGHSYTYAGLCDAIAARAGSLVELGIRRGDRLALMASNRPEAIELVFAAMWLGVIAVPLNVAVRGAQLEHMLRNSGARMLILEEDSTEALTTVEGTLPELERVLLLDSDEDRRLGSFAASPLPSPGTPVGPARLAGPDPAAILYTSGTTGPSKGVCCPHAQLYWFGVGATELLDLQKNDVLHTTLPFFHINAMTGVLQALLVGGSLVIEPRFSASQFWARLVESQATVTYVLGAMVRILANREPSELDTAHRVRIALSPGTPPDLLDTVRERFGIELVDGYASTETNVAIGTGPGRQRPGIMGTVRDGYEAKIVDENDVEVPDDTPGELILRHREPFAFMTGYFRMPDKTVEAWRNLWFHTGDRVVRQSDGYLCFVDRLKDAIRRRGENISSWEVEQALLAHPAVAQAAVFPVPSELGEDEVMAALVLHERASIDMASVVAHCEQRLASFAVPRYIEVFDELPLTESGKVRKVALRERGVSATTWDREPSRSSVART